MANTQKITQDILNSLKTIYLLNIMEEGEQMELFSLIKTMEEGGEEFLKTLSFQNYLFINHIFQSYKEFIKN